MRKRFIALFCAMMTGISCASCSGGEVKPSEATETSVAESALPETEPIKAEPLLVAGNTYTAHATEYGSFDCLDDTWHIVQGGYFTGEYFYVAMLHNDDPDSRVKIVKLDSGCKVVQVSEPLDLDHANNITYNGKKDLLLVTHCQSNVDNRYAWYSFVKPDTLELVESGELDHPFFAMAYSEERDMYASGEWAGEVVDTWNGELENVGSYKVETPKTLSQGMWCDKDYIWFVRSMKDGYACEIRVYNWDGELCFQIPIEGMEVEPESITIIGNDIYVICNNSKYNGGIVYTLKLK